MHLDYFFSSLTFDINFFLTAILRTTHDQGFYEYANNHINYIEIVCNGYKIQKQYDYLFEFMMYDDFKLISYIYRVPDSSICVTLQQRVEEGSTVEPLHPLSSYSLKERAHCYFRF